MLMSRTVRSEPESAYAWLRLGAAVLLGTFGSAALWTVPVVLPVLQSEFAVSRADASLPYTLVMIGFAGGGVLTGKLTDRLGIVPPLLACVATLAAGYIGAGLAPSLTVFAVLHLVIGIGASASFGPLIADTSQWFTRNRGIAVAVVACGNYLAGTVWPPVLTHFIAIQGWRATHIGIGVVCAAAMLPLLAMMRRPPPLQQMDVVAVSERAELGLSPRALQTLLCVAGLACCVAMAMPQVHIVAYCGDLGYGVARGAEMLSLMLGFGIVSRIMFGLVADRIGGTTTLLLSSSLQALALLLYLVLDGLASLYVVSALFGLFQGGIVPMYAVIIRRYFPPQEAGARIGVLLMWTLLGMALGGWMSGAIFDLTGSYRAAFANGLAWNLVNMAIVGWLWLRPGRVGLSGLPLR
jgi:MFS family permease